MSSRHFDIAYPSRMPFYLYGTRQGMHIDHILVQAPNSQLSASEIICELIEGNESVVAEGLNDGLIAVADALPEHLMQPFTSDRLESFFHPGAKLDVTIYLDDEPDESDEADQSQGHRRYDLCDNLGDPIARARITLGDNTFVDEYMINLDSPAVAVRPTMPQTSKSKSKISMMQGCFPEVDVTLTLQDHPLFRGYAPGGPGTTDRQASASAAAGSTQSSSWRAVWDKALADRQFVADIDSNPVSDDSATSDTESEVDGLCVELQCSTTPRLGLAITHILTFLASLLLLLISYYCIFPLETVYPGTQII